MSNSRDDSFEVLDHPADILLRIRGKSLRELFANAAVAMCSMMVEIDTVAPRTEVRIQATGDDLADTFVRWLGEVLYLAETEHMFFREFEMDEVSQAGASGRARGEQIDLARHRPDAEIKAVTYHGAIVEESGDGWVAEVLLDV